MDPNEALRQLRMVTENAHVIDYGNHREVTELLRDMIDHVSALDEWMTRGGFLPTAWEAHR